MDPYCTSSSYCTTALFSSLILGGSLPPLGERSTAEQCCATQNVIKARPVVDVLYSMKLTHLLALPPFSSILYIIYWAFSAFEKPCGFIALPAGGVQDAFCAPRRRLWLIYMMFWKNTFTAVVHKYDCLTKNQLRKTGILPIKYRNFGYFWQFPTFWIWLKNMSSFDTIHTVQTYSDSS